MSLWWSPLHSSPNGSNHFLPSHTLRNSSGIGVHVCMLNFSAKSSIDLMLIWIQLQTHWLTHVNVWWTYPWKHLFFMANLWLNLPNVGQNERRNWRLAKDKAERYLHWSKYVKFGAICVMKSSTKELASPKTSVSKQPWQSKHASHKAR